MPTFTPETGAASGLAGKVVAASDVSTIPDEPLPDQLVLLLPAEAAAAALGLPGGVLDPEQLRFTHATIQQAPPGTATAVTDAEGRFNLELPPGEYVLCLADSEAPPAGFPVTTRGCAVVAVAPGEVKEVIVSSGFGEIVLLEP
jgi:hypothetical protein